MRTARAYDAARMLLAALAKAGPDRARLRDALEQLSGVDAVTSAAGQPFSRESYGAITGQAMFVAPYKDGVLSKDK